LATTADTEDIEANLLFFKVSTSCPPCPPWCRGCGNDFATAFRPELQLARRLPRSRLMSQKTVQLVIGWLLTDEELRVRFTERPRETLTELRRQGYELTEGEMDALLLCDPTMWMATAQKIHPNLRRASLRGR